jgi:hypothetical protein
MIKPLIISLMVAVSAAESQAACTSPAAAAGEMQWISSASTVKYCDGSIWHDTSRTTGASCAGTTAGTLNYAAGILNFCNGTNWINTKGSSLGSCAGTTAGTFNYNTGVYRFCDSTNWYQMGPPLLTVDAATVARTTGAPANNVDLTTASFTPPNNSLLLLMINADQNSSATFTLVVSDSGAHTWTNSVSRSDGVGGHASAWYTTISTGQSMTISVKRTTANGGTNTISFKTYIVGNYDQTTPIGATGNNFSATNDLTASLYTSTVNASRGFGTATDWSALGTPISTDTGDAGTTAGAISYISAYKAADTASSGTAVTMNFDAATGTPAWNWVGIEIRPAP